MYVPWTKDKKIASVKHGHWWRGIVAVNFEQILWLSKDECLAAESRQVDIIIIVV